MFLAHPFDKKHKEQAKEIKDEFEGTLEIVLPEAEQDSTILFCKICKQIRECTGILSELTTLNRNVIFEHGFALATGCRGIVATDASRKGVDLLEALTDVERVPYYSNVDIVDFLLTLAAESKLLKQYDTDGAAKILGDWSLSQFPSDRDRVCFLKTDQPSTNAVRRIQKVLTRSKFKLKQISPEEHEYHLLHDYCRIVGGSFAVVGHFVSDQAVNHEKHNALTALLLGIAMGLGKRVLVFQETPIEKPMVDLKGVLHKYENLQDIENVLSSQLEAWHEEATLEKEDAFEVMSTKATQYAIHSLGSPEAENDEFLSKAFYVNRAFDLARRAERFMIIGRKGSGKSAIFRQLSEILHNTTKRRFIFVDFTTLEIEQIGELYKDLANRISAELFFRVFWRSNLVLEIADEFLKAAGPEFEGDPKFEVLKEWRKGLAVEGGTNYVDRFLSMLNIDVSKGELIDPELILRFRFADIDPVLGDLISGFEIVIYTDDLDASWIAGSDTSRLLVKTYVHESFGLSKTFPNVVKPVLFMQEALLAHLQRGVIESDKWSTHRLRWSAAELQEMLELRLRLSMEASTSDVRWDAILPISPIEQPTIEYLLDRTMLRPRDALNLFQKIVDLHDPRKPFPISLDTMYKALNSFSSDRILNLSNEMSFDYPKLEELVTRSLPAFQRGPSCEWEVARAIASDAFVATRELPSWASSGLCRGLFEAGAICYVDADGKYLWSRFVLFDRARALAEKVESSWQEPRFTLLPWLGSRAHSETTCKVDLHPALHGLVNRRGGKIEYFE